MLITMPPDRGGNGPSGVAGLRRFLSQFPISNGMPAKRHGPFNKMFSSAFQRTDP